LIGEFFFCEGHTQKQITLPIRVFKLLGVEVLIGEFFFDMARLFLRYLYFAFISYECVGFA